jgi:hypothetical protein
VPPVAKYDAVHEGRATVHEEAIPVLEVRLDPKGLVEGSRRREGPPGTRAPWKYTG